MRLTRNFLFRIKHRYFNEYFPKNSINSKDLKGSVTLDKIVNEYNNQSLSIESSSFISSENQMNRWGAQNKVKTSYYGLGYYPSHIPSVLKTACVSSSYQTRTNIAYDTGDSFNR